MKAHIYVEPNCQPLFYKARPTPYAMREMIDREIDRLIEQDIIEPVQFSDWAAPVVPVVKADGKSVRLCGDYSVTVNKVAKTDRYPIPKIEDLYAQLGNGMFYTKLDMRHAYEQITLDEESRKYVTVNTQRGLFQYKRLPYGVNSAPAIFQRIMESLVKDIPRTMVYLDDILVAGNSTHEHLQTVDTVLTRLKDAGFRLKQEKCEFMKTSVEYLGHKIDATGIHASGKTLAAIHNAPAPTNVSELRALLGMINHYSRFVPNLANTLAPLHELLKKDVKWHWSQKEEKSFRKIQEELSSPKVVVHYDPAKPLTLTCDASAYGVGCVLSHLMNDGSEKPIAYYSRTLTPAEKKYSQLDKEALGIIAGVTKFQQYLWGREFTIYTDHRPLIQIFNEQKPVPQMASPRMQRWSLLLAGYKYHIVYKAGNTIPHADALSRLPDPTAAIPQVVPVPGDIYYNLSMLKTSLVTCSNIRRSTERDPILSKVMRYTRDGFPEKTSDISLQPYFTRKRELSIQDGCLLWGTRVVIPPKERTDLLNMLHENHTGIVRMKAVARSVMWWPGIDSDIESVAKSCNICQHAQALPAKAPLSPWAYPQTPWSRLHIDYAGPINGKMILVIIDAHSKWNEAFITTGCTTTTTIAKLRQTFATHGVPEMIVSDNGPAFTSGEFKVFCEQNGIKHITSAPHHPSTNSCAERAVATVKNALKCIGGDMETGLQRFLFDYRITPQMTTGQAPCELLMRRKIRSRFDLIRPDLSATVKSRQLKQKQYHDKNTKSRVFKVGDSVLALYFRGNKTEWINGVITKITGPLSYLVDIGGGQLIRRHVDQIRSCLQQIERPSGLSPEILENIAKIPMPNLAPTQSTTMEAVDAPPAPVQPSDHAAAPVMPPTNITTEVASPRRSGRMRKAPDRLDL